MSGGGGATGNGVRNWSRLGGKQLHTQVYSILMCIYMSTGLRPLELHEHVNTCVTYAHYLLATDIGHKVNVASEPLWGIYPHPTPLRTQINLIFIAFISLKVVLILIIV